MIRKISAHYVFPVSEPAVKFGIVVVNNLGEIVEVIDNQGIFKEAASVEFFDGILVPGFVYNSEQTVQHALESLKTLHFNNPQLSLEDAIYQVTLGEAIKKNKAWYLGSFEQKKRPGISLISPIDFQNMRLKPESVLKILVPSGSDSN
jgi:hypothetical protein